MKIGMVKRRAAREVVNMKQLEQSQVKKKPVWQGQMHFKMLSILKEDKGIEIGGDGWKDYMQHVEEIHDSSRQSTGCKACKECACF